MPSPKLPKPSPKVSSKKKPPTFLKGKLGPQQYDDLVNRKYEKTSYLKDQEPGNGD